MALAGALSPTLSGACGLTNKSLRALTARLLGTPYSASQMTYDLRRLRLNGLIRRIEHTHTYVLTPDRHSRLGSALADGVAAGQGGTDLIGERDRQQPPL
jgi:hypothetical protein